MVSLDIADRLNAFVEIFNPILLRNFTNWFADKGGEITKMDIRQYPVSLPLYAQANLFGTFDGATVYLHEDEQAIGGAHYTTLDAMHLGVHCLQMSMPHEMAQKCGLEFDKDLSRREIYEANNENINISRMLVYEAETHSIILGYLESIRPFLEEHMHKPGESYEALKSAIHDFYAADLTYVEYVLTHSELPTLAEFMKRLDVDGSERRRFEDIRRMIREVPVEAIKGAFVEKLPDGDLIFGVRGPQGPLTNEGSKPPRPS